MTSSCLEPVVISLTTISSRINYVEKTLKTLLSQTYFNFNIFLYISKEGYLLDEGIDKIPLELARLKEKHNNLFIEFTENTGPYRKLIPSLKKYWGTNQLLVTVDDDVLYPDNFLATLVTAEQIHGCPVAFRGRVATANNTELNRYKAWKRTDLAGRSFANVPTGKDGVAYRPQYFRESVLDIKKAVELARTADDLWFKWNTALNGKESCLLFDSLEESFRNATSKEEAGVTLFDEYNQSGKNDEVVLKLETYFKAKTKKTLFEIIS